MDGIAALRDSAPDPMAGAAMAVQALAAASIAIDLLLSLLRDGGRIPARLLPIIGAIVLTDALLVLATVVIMQQVENSLLQPFIMGRAVRLRSVRCC